MAASQAPTTVDWAGWLRRWDLQQQVHMPDREDRFAAMLDALRALDTERPRILDLGCGPGSLSARLLRRFPAAEIVAVDADPVLLAIGRGALASEPNLHFVEADLSGDWASSLPITPPFDAAVSTTALHWLSLPDLVRLYRVLAGLLRPGAVFLDGDHLGYATDQRRIGEIARAVRPAWKEAPSGAEDYDTWWARVQDEPALAAALAERNRRWHDHPHHEPQTYDFHRAALFAAGFAEVGTLWQRLTDRVLIAVR